MAVLIRNFSITVTLEKAYNQARSRELAIEQSLFFESTFDSITRHENTLPLLQTV